jgi:hypothetical protein
MCDERAGEADRRQKAEGGRQNKVQDEQKTLDAKRCKRKSAIVDDHVSFLTSFVFWI